MQRKDTARSVGDSLGESFVTFSSQVGMALWRHEREAHGKALLVLAISAGEGGHSQIIPQLCPSDHQKSTCS